MARIRSGLGANRRIATLWTTSTSPIPPLPPIQNRPQLIAESAVMARATDGAALTVSPPVGTSDGDLLIAIYTHSFGPVVNEVAPGVIPAPWQLLHHDWDMEGNGQRFTFMAYLPVPDAAALASSWTFNEPVQTGQSRCVLTVFRVTGADLTNPLLGGSAGAANEGVSVVVPDYQLSGAGGLTIFEWHGQVQSPRPSFPPSATLGTKQLEYASGDDESTTRTVLAVFTADPDDATEPYIQPGYTASAAESAAASGSTAVTIAPAASAPSPPDPDPSVIEDSFTGPAGTLLTDHVGENGLTWTQHALSGNVNATLSEAGRVYGVGSGSTRGAFFRPFPAPPSDDYSVEADITIVSPIGRGYIGARWREGGWFYAFGLYGTSLGFQMLRYEGSTASVYSFPLSSARVRTIPSFAVGQTYRLKLEVDGDELRGYVDGELTLVAVDPPPLFSGPPGLYFEGIASETTGYHFDNFRVTELPADTSTTHMRDSFTGAAGALVEEHVGEGGLTWTRHPQVVDRGPIFVSSSGTLYYGAHGASSGPAFLRPSVDPPSDDYTVQASVIGLSATASTTHVTGVVARLDAASLSGYMVRYEATGNRLRLYRVDSDVNTQLWQSTETLLLTTGREYRLALRVQGSTIEFLLNGGLLFSTTDTTYPTGGPGIVLGLESNYSPHTDTTGHHLDNFRVFS